jgi:lipoyl synthase
MKDLRKPFWLKKRVPPIEDILKVKLILKETGLYAVCDEARCPNLDECFSRGTATILILRRICTRSCGFCAVEHGVPLSPDEKEPTKVAQAIKEMVLKYVVITSVTRDDLVDGGASYFAKTIQAIRALDREIKVEVLNPDFKGDFSSLVMVLNERPDVLNHNIETIPRLFPEVRPKASYKRLLNLLRESRKSHSHILTKSGFVVGLGEMKQEVLGLLDGLKEVGCGFLTIGQYLSPEEVNKYKRIREGVGFKSVSSGPFVRSSFHADQIFHTHILKIPVSSYSDRKTQDN